MSIKLSEEVLLLLNDPKTFKALATVDYSGTPNVVFDSSVYVGEDGNIYYLELLETSHTNHNLVNSIWFDRQVSIVFQGSGNQSFQIKGKPIEVHITGELFQKHYVEIRQKLGDVDLTGVWVIEPLEVIDENFWIRKEKEEAERPIFRHLDRLAKVYN
jgi:hypothetical protein